jgi:hypothetical protein
MRVAPVLALALVPLAGCGACEPEKTPPPGGSASASAGVAPPPSIASRPPRAIPPAAPKLACRAIAVDGDVHLAPSEADAGATAVLLQGLVPIEGWLDVAKGARLVAKDPRTTRETTFRGPARARACVDFGEESWVASGAFESTVGAGEGPGQEEWVVTPFGVVRYAAAKVTIDVKPTEADLAVESGVAFAWRPSPPDGGQPGRQPADAGSLLEEGWARLVPGRATLAGVRGEEGMASAAGARLAVGRCTTLATSARTLAAQVMSPDGGADGGTIAAQVMTRRLARAACAVASLRVRALPPGDSAPLARPLADANAAWSAIP